MMESKGQSIRENSGNRDQARPGEGRASQVNAWYIQSKPGRGQKEAWRWMEMALGTGLRLRLRIENGWGRPKAPPPVMLCE
jgi:hypothetical protein